MIGVCGSRAFFKVESSRAEPNLIFKIEPRAEPSFSKKRRVKSSSRAFFRLDQPLIRMYANGTQKLTYTSTSPPLAWLPLYLLLLCSKIDFENTCYRQIFVTVRGDCVIVDHFFEQQKFKTLFTQFLHKLGKVSRKSIDYESNIFANVMGLDRPLT